MAVDANIYTFGVNILSYIYVAYIHIFCVKLYYIHMRVYLKSVI